MSDEERFGEFSSVESNLLLNWAYVFRNALTKSAESFEADPSDENQLKELISLVGELIVLADGLPMPDLAMDPLDLVPLQRLLEGLVLIDGGYHDEMLDPARSKGRFRQRNGRFERTPGRRASSVRERRVRAHGVAFFRLLTATGQKESEAKSLVADVFTQAGLSGHRSDAISRQSVHTWVKEAQELGKRPAEGHLASEYERLWRKQLSGGLTFENVCNCLNTQAQILAKR